MSIIPQIRNIWNITFKYIKKMRPESTLTKHFLLSPTIALSPRDVMLPAVLSPCWTRCARAQGYSWFKWDAVLRCLRRCLIPPHASAAPLLTHAACLVNYTHTHTHTHTHTQPSSSFCHVLMKHWVYLRAGCFVLIMFWGIAYSYMNCYQRKGI